jgi:hypothetical protein
MPKEKVSQPMIVLAQFPKATEIIWEDVLEKIEWDSTNYPESVKYLGNEIINGDLDPDNLPTMILHSTHYPASIENAVNEVGRLKEVKDMCLYVSFNADAPTLGPHSNKKDILLVGGPGKVGYALTGTGETWLTPGDLLYIPAGTIYEEVTTGARATMRFDL